MRRLGLFDVTMLVMGGVIGSGIFMATRTIARFATSIGTPATSKMMVPGLTRAAQYSTSALPVPIRVSRGFFEMGLSGKTRR